MGFLGALSFSLGPTKQEALSARGGEGLRYGADRACASSAFTANELNEVATATEGHGGKAIALGFLIVKSLALPGVLET